MDELTKYLTDTLPVNTSWVELEKYAARHHVPIMDQVSMHFVLTILQMRQPAAILEVGTAIGYSSMRMAAELPHATITTIEKEAEMVEQAKNNFKTYSYQQQINVLQGDGLDVMKDLANQGSSYDCVFIDAAKGKYESFFELANDIISPKGIIICDNILFRGYVAGTDYPEQKRLQKLTEKLRRFNRSLLEDERYKTSIMPIGDGVSLSVKR